MKRKPDDVIELPRKQNYIASQSLTPAAIIADLNELVMRYESRPTLGAMREFDPAIVNEINNLSRQIADLDAINSDAIEAFTTILAATLEGGSDLSLELISIEELILKIWICASGTTGYRYLLAEEPHLLEEGMDILGCDTSESDDESDDGTNLIFALTDLSYDNSNLASLYDKSAFLNQDKVINDVSVSSLGFDFSSTEEWSTTTIPSVESGLEIAAKIIGICFSFTAMTTIDMAS